jgi:hypothetical protein
MIYITNVLVSIGQCLRPYQFSMWSRCLLHMVTTIQKHLMIGQFLLPYRSL